MVEQGGRIGEITDAGGEVAKVHSGRRRSGLLCTLAFLQTVERDAACLGERLERVERDRTLAVRPILRIPAPDQPDFESSRIAGLDDERTPFGNALQVRADIGPAPGNAVQSGAE